jgi:hypothetical protein
MPATGAPADYSQPAITARVRARSACRHLNVVILLRGTAGGSLPVDFSRGRKPIGNRQSQVASRRQVTCAGDRFLIARRRSGDIAAAMNEQDYWPWTGAAWGVDVPRQRGAVRGISIYLIGWDCQRHINAGDTSGAVTHHNRKYTTIVSPRDPWSRIGRAGPLSDVDAILSPLVTQRLGPRGCHGESRFLSFCFGSIYRLHCDDRYVVGRRRAIRP